MTPDAIEWTQLTTTGTDQFQATKSNPIRYANDICTGFNTGNGKYIGAHHYVVWKT